MNLQRYAIILLGMLLWPGWSRGTAPMQDRRVARVKHYLDSVAGKTNIPGFSLGIVDHGKVTVFNYGYASAERMLPVSSHTLFEIGSCTKAFTAVAVERLIEEGKLKSGDAVSAYLPGFIVRYRGKQQQITIAQLLHHTSGIPWSSLGNIPASNAEDALRRTVYACSGSELVNQPGSVYEYATINYDILALVVEKVSGMPFEDYLRRQVLAPLQLHHTFIGQPADPGLLAQGYKIGFFRPHAYNAPRYRGNNAAGYIITDIVDMVRWLRIQMGVTSVPLSNIIKKTHRRDLTVSPVRLSSYAEGWQVSLNGDDVIFHSGLNPNFSSFIGFMPSVQAGVVLLTNSNSGATDMIGANILNLLAGRSLISGNAQDGDDKTFSLIAMVMGLYLLALCIYLAYLMVGIVQGSRPFSSFSKTTARKLITGLFVLMPLSAAVAILPKAMAGFTWNAAVVWSPVSFVVMVRLLMSAFVASYLFYALELFFPQRDAVKSMAPKIVIVSIITGLSSMILILLITGAINTDVRLGYLAFYYLLTLAISLAGKRFVKIRMVNFTRDQVYKLRMRLISHLFSTNYQAFEKVDRGRLFTTLNEDAGLLGDASNTGIALITSVCTALGVFLYLATIAFWATGLTILLIVILTTAYYFISRNTNEFFRQASTAKDSFMRLVSGMINGYKELNLHQAKKLGYQADLGATANEFKRKDLTASIRFIYASLFGEIILNTILGIVAFVVPHFFTSIPRRTILTFVIVLLYLIGPVNAILGSIPTLLRIRVSWQRIQKLLKEMPSASGHPTETKAPRRYNVVRSIEFQDVGFKYTENNGSDFGVGPLNLKILAGEIIFIIGGNGSGKTTFAKLLTGLYAPDAGVIRLNGNPVDPSELGEYFSVVFSPHYLFPKMYLNDVLGEDSKIAHYLQLLKLDQKVSVDGQTFSSIDLSGGQRKRLALLQCYLENNPIYLFDEWAADQDPEYRSFFYKTLIPDMKKAGKIVIAITHDDHYFNSADRVFKMDQGKLCPWSAKSLAETL